MNITKTAMITVCGRPNVGKSSLTNALVGEKIAIVSDKPQTTRNRIYGVVNRGDTQYVLLDTPGLHKPRSRLGDYMVKVVRESLSDVECALLLVEPIAHVGEPERVLLQRIQEEHLPCVLCINKIDTVEKKEALLEVIAAYSEAYDGFDAIIPISARTGDGQGLLAAVAQGHQIQIALGDLDVIAEHAVVLDAQVADARLLAFLLLQFQNPLLAARGRGAVFIQHLGIAIADDAALGDKNRRVGVNCAGQQVGQLRQGVQRIADSGSSEAMGSSARITFACCISARAIATRCCCPPERVETR